MKDKCRQTKTEQKTSPVLFRRCLSFLAVKDSEISELQVMFELRIKKSLPAITGRLFQLKKLLFLLAAV
jgi:hypothetical protein